MQSGAACFDEEAALAWPLRYTPTWKMPAPPSPALDLPFEISPIARIVMPVDTACLSAEDSMNSTPEGSAAPSGAGIQKIRYPRLRIGLVNNMPDGALLATECQFHSLLNAAAKDEFEIELSFYSLPEIRRSGDADTRVKDCYQSLGKLSSDSPDALIVTGREPAAAALKDEAYWNSLAQLHDWARENTYSTVWSCLAAHAAVHHGDGIERTRGPRKLSGVYQCERYSLSPLTRGLPLYFSLPHSRWNGIAESALQRHGYQILSRGSEVGADIFVKEYESLFVFFQGHPEYQAETLMLEYCRDVSRYLSGASNSLPMIPENYFAPETEEALAGIYRKAENCRDKSLEQELMDVLVNVQVEAPWAPIATRIYKNWLEFIHAQKCKGKRQRSVAGNHILQVERSAAGRPNGRMA